MLLDIPVPKWCQEIRRIKILLLKTSTLPHFQHKKQQKYLKTRTIASGYANRPWIHKEIIRKVAEGYADRCPFQNGLDVGCGAGLSTKALRLICECVTGADISVAMIDVCKNIYKDTNYDFYVANAEKIRLADKKYDIVTAAGMVNWVDKDAFLDCMHDVMTVDGLLIIYDFWITDQMLENSAYKNWYQNQYLVTFPQPLRKENIWKQDEMGEHFLIRKQTTHEIQWKFKLEEFVEFMMIQSNVNIRIESGEKTVKEVREWMMETLYPIFDGVERTLVFDEYCWFIEHCSNTEVGR